MVGRGQDKEDKVPNQKARCSQPGLSGTDYFIVVADEVRSANVSSFVLCGMAHMRKLKKTTCLCFYTAACPRAQNRHHRVRKLKLDAR